MSRIVSIFTSLETKAPLLQHESIEAIAGKGLVGDRYATGKGFYTGVVEWDAHVTLIAEEPFSTLTASRGVEIDPQILRRNFVTQGITMESLIGREFQIGDHAILRGRKLWPPCMHIVTHTGRKEIFQYLAKHTGLGADVLVSGLIRAGDPIRLLPE